VGCDAEYSLTIEIFSRQLPRMTSHDDVGYA